MEKIENENTELIQSQKSLYKKFKRINRLFKIQFSSLLVYFLFTTAIMIIWIYQLINGQLTKDLYQQYGSLGIPWNIILASVIFLTLIFIGMHIFNYSIFLIKGTRCLKQVKQKEEIRSGLYSGIVPYIKNFYTFFNRARINRYTKKKMNLEKLNLVVLVKNFLFLNFISGYLIVTIIALIIDVEEVNLFQMIYNITYFLILTFWLINLLASIIIRREVVKWEKLFPKLDEWGHELENLSIQNFDNEEFS